MVSEVSLTRQLQQYSGGDREIAEAVLRLVMPRLHQIALKQLRREQRFAPISPTELIHEVWLRNLRKGGWQVRDREHFYAIAARAMRQVLVDLARHRLASARGSGATPESLDQRGEGDAPVESGPEQVVEIGILMEKLERADPATARVVEMHYFAGFTLEEIGEITGLSFRQVRNRWEKGRDWLKRRLTS
jgi:RNA polymerase sigma factor (TIGR02999 family)